MRKLFLGILLLLSILSFSQNVFTDVDLVDGFGDKIGTVKRNVSYGRFSNSATNDSELRVHSFLTLNLVKYENMSLDDYKEFLRGEYKKINMSESDIEYSLKFITEKNYKKFIKPLDNMVGAISFDLYEYNKHIASFIEKYGIISIKTKDNKKITAKFNIVNGKIMIIGYKELTKGENGIENQIKYGFYDWNQTLIFNEIINSTNTQIIILIGTSVYSFEIR